MKAKDFIYYDTERKVITLYENGLKSFKIPFSLFCDYVESIKKNIDSIAGDQLSLNNGDNQEVIYNLLYWHKRDIMPQESMIYEMQIKETEYFNVNINPEMFFAAVCDYLGIKYTFVQNRPVLSVTPFISLCFDNLHTELYNAKIGRDKIDVDVNDIVNLNRVQTATINWKFYDIIKIFENIDRSEIYKSFNFYDYLKSAWWYTSCEDYLEFFNKCHYNGWM